MIASLPPVIAVAESSEPVGPSNVGLGSVVLTIAVVIFLGWIGYLVINSRRKTRPPEEPAPNQEFFMDDEGLENNRLTRILTAAVIAAAVLAIVMPIYFVNETSRQEAAAEEIIEDYIHFGEEWWVKFECGACHGPDGGGGAAEIVEERSGLTASWAAPANNDVFFRYSEEEVRHWIVNGRSGTPMPASGLEGGGAMTVQEVDQTIEYLRSLQITQMEAFAKVDDDVKTALDRIAGGAATIETRIVVENAKLADIQDGPAQFAIVEKMPDDIDALLGGAGTCTVESAALVGAVCTEEGPDADRDGLTDDVEPSLTALAQLAYETLTKRSIDRVTLEESTVFDDEFDLEFSPTSPFSMTDATGNPIPDLESAEAFISHLDAKHLEWSLLTDRNEQFAEPVINGLAFLEAALQQRAWDVDFDQVAADTGLTRAEAERSVGLFNAYCARCHTAGYSAGVEFEQEPGSGAWAPALTDGRTLVQFPDEQDHINFIINGANASERYGVNGLSGVGGMPAFGAVLSLEDIELIVIYERSM
ncbi:MAG: c-type cytochrome [Acidimicrobiia bacterium]|nr:c-type cytochrome [Acidimicrobiia bacterium]